MSDLAWMSIWMLLSLGAGLPLVRLLPPRLFAHRVLAAPAAGYALLAMVSTLTYAGGVSLRSTFVASVVVCGGALAWGAARIRKDLGGTAPAIGAWVLAVVLLLAPKWTTGYQFFVYQGNPWDTFGYLESAVVYARDAYAAIKSAPAEALAADALYQTAARNLEVRPSVHVLYALLGQLDVAMMPRLHYTFLVFLMSQCVLSLSFLIANLFAVSLARSAVVAFAFTAGFWGQSIVDMNAWSQVSSMAIHVVCVAVAAVLLGRVEEMSGRLEAARAMGAVGTLSASAMYLYPEGFVFHALGLGAMMLYLIAVEGNRWRRVAVVIGASGVFAAWIYPCYAFVASNGIRQARWARTTPVEWWTFFQAYWFGRTGIRRPGLGLAIDVLGGSEGLYFLTPPAGFGPWARAGAYVGLAALCGGLIAAAVVTVRRATRRDGARAMVGAVSALVAAEVTAVVAIASQRLLWAAGKALSYASPYWTLWLCLPLLLANRLRLRPSALVIPSVVLIAAQMGFAVARPVVGLHRDGIHFAPPYPGVNSVEAKREYRWNIDDIARQVAGCARVGVAVPNEWIRRYLIVLFTAAPRAMASKDAAECVVDAEETRPGGPKRLVVLRRPR